MKTSSSLGFFEKMQESLDAFFASFNLTSKNVILYLTFFAFGFASGLLFRRYGKMVVTLILGVVIALAVLQYFDFIMINQNYIRCLFGMQDLHSCSDYVQFLYEFCMQFLLEIIILVVAFLVGFKLG
jgi:hypothetical protein